MSARETNPGTDNQKDKQKLPGVFKAFVEKYPALAEAHEEVAQTVDAIGPLDRRVCQLIKIGIAMGAGLESATRSHVRRACEAGATQEEIEQAILLGMNTVGFPRTVAAWSWAQMQFERDRQERSPATA
ncbi:MAG TPA: carboxymuconolactone decarboxylase family protein [Phycisphaerae bacterium]|nr:carboxymuconolactone decarboxylase family protein [Phycisphaerae bacterium]HOJ75098.1 carboxymuconolactone decarboxylase family protein [Phycisphaerae bacterium]HOM53483.1 carboxymuconolactone decarboxylase family protein [Phycisphaerae bacterium]HON66847.1 carboxymuconolactone decarboxylase family protein [Phycisphaerae bacterium]HOQ86513.1 carboxymuconolactone decarboxylase family protein [Phycisphaerae bacterium]